MLWLVELHLFDEVGEAVRGLVPAELGVLRMRVHRYGVKTWFDARDAPREHYEAQVVGARHVLGASVLAVEIGFHAEHRDVIENDAAIARLASKERSWRRTLGPEPQLGPFIGRPDDWRRVSEAWPDPDLDDPTLPLELASRLVDYMSALEPIRRGPRATTAARSATRRSA